MRAVKTSDVGERVSRQLGFSFHPKPSSGRPDKAPGRMLAAHAPPVAWAGCLSLLLAGCGSGTPVVPVSGTVSFVGRERPQVCRLSFLPTEAAEGMKLRPNGATMQPDGTYEMTPHLGVEGLLPGAYAVRVSYFDLKPGGNPDREADWIEYTYEAPPLVVDADASSVVYDVEVTAKK